MGLAVRGCEIRPKHNMDISIELVPRNKQYLEDALTDIQQQLPAINTINIPDISRYEMRSWEGCLVARDYFPTSIPHIRAADTEPDMPLPMIDALVERGVNKLLIVTGDWDQSEKPAVTSVDLIRRLKREYPQLTLYGALDPYRQDFYSEVAYARQKIEAGASGFFTQPFFDLRLMEIYADLLHDTELYWGVAPVVTKRSRRYWEQRNKAIFPASFDCSLEWNRALAQQALQFAKNGGDSIYFMPIRVNVVDYLAGIL
ncbi:MAG: methylenetetrahydrofolate reductase [Candidatus Promineifilaceae bacterium]